MTDPASSPPAKRTWDGDMVPASVGKSRAVHEPEVSKLRGPSSEEGQKQANKFVNFDAIVDRVDVPSLYVSSNSFALTLVKNLERIVKRKVIDQKYIYAANAFVRERTFLERDLLKTEQLGINERYFTGLFAQALNSFLGDGMVVNHLECIGEGTTHSGVSGRYFRGSQPKPILMVGEAKLGDDRSIRADVRCQLAHEFIRHRGIDKIRGIRDFAPVLLVALNYTFVSLELAFPSTKGGSMESNQWVRFKDCNDGTETFWTVPIAFVPTHGGDAGFKLPRLFNFVDETLWELHKLRESATSRVQFKTPWTTLPSWFKETSKVESKKYGDNVTILSANGKKYVYKEFCYYLRSEDNFNYVVDPSDLVEPADQRKPPDEGLLTALGPPYRSWHTEDGPFGIKILSYEYLEGRHHPESTKGWVEVLSQIEIMHSKDWVHGDLLPRNLVFDGENGYVIDFDLSRQQNEPYTMGYVYEAFKQYRHPNAQSEKQMKKEHDVWALVKLSEDFFVMPDGWVDIEDVSVADLKHWFTMHGPEMKELGAGGVDAEATSSPQRRI